ncbi:hypothetical protein MARCHEWKA_03390 [Brevundimonas phage vB_BpoS-Marchewka]|uniref:Uncharacterized protein n=1 Tax=Brevundimonas phage vB_BpoS-Marchewka TaxID=2948604 RepID=A0A9E7SSJ2_9CAUD|nr:hypothetical protein MARCHEWKA_03390 [Brevundimonas phage vB_BpoS-Marchewka]UTC29297.1 hypothetical protein BAMBUS_02150 [Brevundimonas phage vB_BpoS-Bambus]
MEPIQYRTVPIKGSTSDVREGFQPDGCRWWLADRRDDVAYGSLTLPTTRDKMAAYQAWPKDDTHDHIGDPEFRKLWAHISPQSEIIYCSRMEMLIALIERLRDPRPAGGTVVEVLKAADFKPTTHIPSLYELDIGKGVIQAWTERGGFKAEYHGNSPWWLNLMNVDTSITTHKGAIWPIHWPAEYGDVEAKAAEFLIEHYIPWVRATRIMRNTR